MNKAGD